MDTKINLFELRMRATLLPTVTKPRSDLQLCVDGGSAPAYSLHSYQSELDCPCDSEPSPPQCLPSYLKHCTKAIFWGHSSFHHDK